MTNRRAATTKAISMQKAGIHANNADLCEIPACRRQRQEVAFDSTANSKERAPVAGGLSRSAELRAADDKLLHTAPHEVSN